MVVPAMMRHMEVSLREDVNVVIILGGTNDLIRHVSGHEIGNGVVQLHESAKRLMREHSNGAAEIHTIAITIPDPHNAKFEEERHIANSMIRDYASKSEGSTFLFDMESIWPVPGSDENESRWSPDKTHFSALGYERMGYELYEVMKSGGLIPPDVSTV